MSAETTDYTRNERHLLNDFQRDLPLEPRPFLHMARQLGISEEQVLEILRQLKAGGAITRVGPVFTPNKVGVSTLAAMAVPQHQLVEVAAVVSRFPEVNHNYEREHRYNLWFVVTAPDQQDLSRVLRLIEDRTGFIMLELPMLEDYYIDLGFRIDWGDENE